MSDSTTTKAGLPSTTAAETTQSNATTERQLPCWKCVF